MTHTATLSSRLARISHHRSTADEVSHLAAEWRGWAEFAWGPEVMPYGMREFGIRDPNGYHLAFTEPA